MHANGKVESQENNPFHHIIAVIEMNKIYEFMFPIF